MGFFQTKVKKKIMIILAMLHLKMVVAVKVVLEALVALMDQISQISLKIFLVTLGAVVGEATEEIQVIEDQI